MTILFQPMLRLLKFRINFFDRLPVPVSLEEFIDEWLPGMHEDVVLIGVNWDENMDGDELEPLDVLAEFDSELS